MCKLTDIVRKNIVYFREIRNMTQEELGLASGIHRAYIGFIERGERPVNIDQLERIARALSIDVTELFKKRNYDGEKREEN